MTRQEIILTHGTVLLIGEGASLSPPSGDTLEIRCEEYVGRPVDPPDAVALAVDQDNDRATVTWYASHALFFVVEWGDGTPHEFVFDEFTANHAYSQSGIYTISVTAYNAVGTTTAHKTISFETPQTDRAATYSRCSRLAVLKTTYSQGGMA